MKSCYRAACCPWSLTLSRTFLDKLRGHLPASARSAIGALAALSLRGAGSLMTLAIFALAARAMPVEEFGRLAIWFNALSFLALAAVLGQDTLISRSWGEYCGGGQPAMARAAYVVGGRVVVVSGIGAGAGVVTLGAAFGFDLPTLCAGAAFVFMQAQLLYASAAARVIAGFFVSEVNRDALWRCVLLVSVAIGGWQGVMTLAAFFAAAAAGMAPAVLILRAAVARRLPASGAAAPDEHAKWRKRAFAMWVSAVIEGASQYADVLLIGFVASSVAAGQYFAAARIANVFMMLASGLGAYVAAHGANLYFAGRIDELQRVFRTVALVALGLAAPVLIFIAFFASQIMSLYGPRYAGVQATLLVLSGAAFIVSMCGLAPGVLLVTGLEALYACIVAVTTALRLLLSAALAGAFGAFGASVGFALVAAPTAIALVVLCRRLRGVDPSIGGLLSPPALT